jgi:hypothetical protein
MGTDVHPKMHGGQARFFLLLKTRALFLMNDGGDHGSEMAWRKRLRGHPCSDQGSDRSQEGKEEEDATELVGRARWNAAGSAA